MHHAAMPACGYTKPWSVRAGGRIALHASSEDPSATVAVRRLDTPAEAIPWRLDAGALPLAHRDILLGSWGEIDDLPQVDGAALTVEAMLTANEGARSLLAWGDVSVLAMPDRRLALRCGERHVTSASPLPRSCWAQLRLGLGGHEATLSVTTLQDEVPWTRLAQPWAAPLIPAHTLRLGRGEDGPAANWRMGRLRYEAPRTCFDWRCGPRGPLGSVTPEREGGPPLRLFNDPTFSCTSARWDGSVHDPRLAPDHYDAIHLHEDDLGPLDWPETASLTVPADAPSGVYAFTIATGRGTEEVPFFVRPDRPHARLAFLAPTLTYAAYADEALPAGRYPWVCDDRAHRFAQANGLLSLYDTHRDGSGVSLKSLDHPKATLRGDYHYPLSGSPHLLPVDLQLLRFCHAAGIAFDLLTDEDLHREGEAALRPYAGLFTGSHHEYWTAPMQEALARWLGHGGNLAHLGGNGFMWVTALAEGRVEVRRGQHLASRTWDGWPGEANLATTGEIGGLWRERGRSEFAVCGTGMTLMGFGPAQPYRRCPESHGPAWDWVFAGAAPGPIGKEGRVLGGAAGYEVDRADARLGTPDGTVTLAQARGFGPDYEIDGNDYFTGGAAERDAARRADMTIRRHAGGGFVFSVGSVAWCGALPEPGDTNGVGTITANVLTRAGAGPG